MRNAQELSLNLIVVGALALLVLLIVGGILIFGGGNLFSGLTSLGPSNEQVALTAFISSCQSKCQTMNLQVHSSDLSSTTSWTSKLPQIKAFCCAYSDLNSDTLKTADEYCFNAYSSCKIGTYAVASFCSHAGTAPIYDYNTVTGCA